MSNSIKIQVIYFAILRELTGLDKETFSIKQGNKPGDVLTSINERHEIDLGINFKIAVNDEFSDWDIELNEGDRLVFIPPVTGG
ncbi:MAG: MoaD/ThiS family protein [Gammaproteobacteria bacterium]|jgi:molybdopterin converting factor subunit 1|nr:MoaD/ThiS family protein [Gammaproteobacteria bacterium]|tara:strand:+ start:290 stop:541 length:252 start_codon:yes stop_codon:yes gene_type:complete